MKKLLFVIFLIVISLSNAQAKYLKLPDGQYFKIPTGKYEDDASLWNCLSYSKYPDSFFNIAPLDCGNITYKKFKEIYFEQNNKKELIPYAIPLFENGDWFVNDKKLSGFELYCDAYKRVNLTKKNAEYQREREYFCGRSIKSSVTTNQTNTQSTTTSINTNQTTGNNNVDISQAIAEALQTDILRTVLVIAIFFLLTIGVSIKNLSKPSHCGRWWGALLGSIIAVLLMFKNPHPTYSETWFVIIVINFALFYAIGFSIAYFWQKLRNKPPSHTANTEDDALWAQALAETEGTNRENGLWAKCLAETNGITEVARAAYIKQRVKQLKSKA